MSVYEHMKPLDMGITLYDDGIKDYAGLIKNKDMLRNFLTCMIENDRFEFISESKVDDFLSDIDNHVGCTIEHRKPFDPYEVYGVRAQGEI